MRNDLQVITVKPPVLQQRLPDVTLSEWAEQYIEARDNSPFYERDIRQVVRKFVAFNREERLDWLTDQMVNRWAKAMKEKGLNAKTVKNRLTTVCAVWRDAFMAEMCETEPRRVVKIKVPRSMPVAWSSDEMRQLLAATDTIPLWFKRTGIRKSLFWRAFVLVAYDSGLRLNDIESLKRTQIEPSGKVHLIMRKTNAPHVFRLRRATVRAIEALEPWDVPAREDVIFWWPAGRTEFFRQFRQLLKRAGLSTTYGLTRRIRRSSATAAEAEQPGSASRHLGHADEGLAKRFYLDPTKLPERVVTPPSLLLPGIEGPQTPPEIDPFETVEVIA